MASTGAFVLVFYELKDPISSFAGKQSMILVYITHKRSRSAKNCGPCSFFYKGRQRKNKAPRQGQNDDFMTTCLSSDSKMKRDSSETKEPP